MYGEKAWRQLHKNTASNIEHVSEAAPHKAAAVQPLTPPSWKLFKLEEPDMQDTAGEVEVNSCGPLHKAKQKHNVQLSALKTNRKQWTIERCSGRSVLMEWHDDDIIMIRVLLL